MDKAGMKIVPVPFKTMVQQTGRYSNLGVEVRPITVEGIQRERENISLLCI